MRLLDLFNQVDDQVVAAGRSLLSMETKADGQSGKTACPLQCETRREPSASGPVRRQATDARVSETRSDSATVDHLLSLIEELTKRLMQLEGLFAKPAPMDGSSARCNGDGKR